MRWSSVLALLQAAFAVPVVVRLARGAGNAPLSADGRRAPAGAISVVIPVLDEAARLAPCLSGLREAGDAVREILVVDGGSRDATSAVVARAAARDARVRWIDASPVPAGWNGKAWGLETGLAASDARSRWLLTLDADVRPQAALPDALVAHAESDGVTALSIATRQELAGGVQAVVHPAFLTTLVYRFGPPGAATSRVGDVQANGQCFLARRAALIATDAFARARTSRNEDVTAARVLASCGERVGFFEAGDLVRVRMHGNWRATWREWPRSLPLDDQYTRLSRGPALAMLALVQALPLPLVLGLLVARARGPLRTVNIALLMLRLGTLAGMRRAYVAPPPAYWLSPLADLPAVMAIYGSALRRRHVWRGRTLVAEHAA